MARQVVNVVLKPVTVRKPQAKVVDVRKPSEVDKYRA